MITAFNGGIFSPQTMYAQLAALCEAYPMLSRRALGTSILGRELPLLELGEGRERILYVGTHHGMEWLTSALLLRFCEELCLAAAAKRTVYGIQLNYILRRRTLCFLPMLNPDGAAIQQGEQTPGDPLAARRERMNGSTDFSRWQANARGVDLNHNYDAGFRAYKRVEASLGIEGGGPTRYSGEYPESEPETAALAGWIRTVRPRGIYTFHTQGEEIYCAAAAEADARRLASLCDYRLACPEGAAAYGGLTDWAGGVLGIPSYTVECGLGENPLPPTDLPQIYLRLHRFLFETLKF